MEEPTATPAASIISVKNGLFILAVVIVSIYAVQALQGVFGK